MQYNSSVSKLLETCACSKKSEFWGANKISILYIVQTVFRYFFLGDSGGGKFEIQHFKVKRVRSSETFEFSPALKKQRYASQSEKKFDYHYIGMASQIC